MGGNALTCLDEELGIDVATAGLNVADSLGQGADVSHLGCHTRRRDRRGRRPNSIGRAPSLPAKTLSDPLVEVVGLTRRRLSPWSMAMASSICWSAPTPTPPVT